VSVYACRVCVRVTVSVRWTRNVQCRKTISISNLVLINNSVDDDDDDDMLRFRSRPFFISFQCVVSISLRLRLHTNVHYLHIILRVYAQEYAFLGFGSPCCQSPFMT